MGSAYTNPPTLPAGFGHGHLNNSPAQHQMAGSDVTRQEKARGEGATWRQTVVFFRIRSFSVLRFFAGFYKNLISYKCKCKKIID
jgi:hypothetical protein